MKKYQDLIIPVVITIFFAAFVYLLAIGLQKRHEIFRFKYEAYKDANLQLAEFDKELRTQRLIFANFPYSHPFLSEIFEIIWTNYEKIVDSHSKLISSFNTLEGLFFSQEVKKYLAQFEKKFSELAKLLEDFALMKETELKIADSDIKTYTNMIMEKNSEINKICATIRSEFLNLTKAIFKEIKIK